MVSRRSRRMRSIVSKICSTMRGPSPCDGSSSRSRSGWAMRPRPSASICCSPPESEPASWARRARRSGNNSSTVSSARARCARAARRYEPSSRFSMTLSVAKTRRPSGTWAMPSAARSLARMRPRSRPRYAMRPSAAVTVPETALSSVVLPAPLGPTSVTNSPSRTSSETPVSARSPPYVTPSPLMVSTRASPCGRASACPDRPRSRRGCV